MRPLRRPAGMLALAAAGVVSGCLAPTNAAPVDPLATPAPAVRLPTADAPMDHQIGEAYAPHAETQVVSRDREARPAPGLYNICYVNAYQAQPHERSWWEAEHPDLLLREDGAYVVDGGWDEILLDISTTAKRDDLAAVVGEWIDGCAHAGFDAVEPDNLDSYTRSGGLLTRADAAAFATLLAARAHEAGLAIAQKNDTDLAPQGRTIGFDFALAEECSRWSECNAYTSTYDSRVFVIEYRDEDLDRGCSEWPGLSVVRRDRDVTGPGSSTYRYAAC